MKELVYKYADKLVKAGLVEKGRPLVGGLEAEFKWNRSDDKTVELEKIFKGLNINALVYSEPAEPYHSIIKFLAENNPDKIEPEDSETRTFLHDLPVIDGFDINNIIKKLEYRKAVIVKGYGVITRGKVSPEEAFIYYSSVCFACFVNFFSLYLKSRWKKLKVKDFDSAYRKVIELIPDIPDEPPELMKGPFESEDDVYSSIIQAGKYVVEYGLVDSFFGNISYRHGNTIYISQTTSSLDELEGHIDPCPIDDSTTAAVTASSEYTSHRDIILRTGNNAILHGHPEFAVIISMDCRKKDCKYRGECHIRCPEERSFMDVPIVPGEVGTGPHGLSNTLPPAMEGNRGVIVYGHGLFTVGKSDFNRAFSNLLDIEKKCREDYFRRIEELQD